MWVITLAAVLALAAACGSSSSSSSSTNSGQSSTPSSSTPSSSGGGGVSDATFCATAKKAIPGLRKEFEGLASQVGTGPAGLKAFLGKEQGVLQAFVAVAPSDIKPSLNVIYSQFNKVVSILAKNHYNFVQAEPELVKVNFDSAAVKQAEAKLNAWGKNTCHFKDG
jgi:hypothetical protein